MNENGIYYPVVKLFFGIKITAKSRGIPISGFEDKLKVNKRKVNKL